MNWNIDTPEGLANAKVWQAGFLKLLTDDAIWAVPRSCAVYRIQQPEKTITSTTGDRDRTIETVFKALGWTVK